MGENAIVGGRVGWTAGSDNRHQHHSVVPFRVPSIPQKRDKKFSFHSYNEGQSSLKSYYPKKGGSEEWIKLLKKQLIKLKVKIITNTRVNKISHKNKKIKSITLNGGKNR